MSPWPKPYVSKFYMRLAVIRSLSSEEKERQSPYFLTLTLCVYHIICSLLYGNIHSNVNARLVHFTYSCAVISKCFFTCLLRCKAKHICVFISPRHCVLINNVNKSDITRQRSNVRYYNDPIQLIERYVTFRTGLQYISALVLFRSRGCTPPPTTFGSLTI